MTNLTENAKNFLKQNPTLVGVVAGYRFYEHPVYGDEAPLVCITPEGKKKKTDWYDLPDLWDLGICHPENIYGLPGIEQSKNR